MRAAGARGLLAVGWIGACVVPDPSTDPGADGADDTEAPAGDLVGILIVPGDVVLPLGEVVHLTATGLGADRTSRDLTAAVTWRSDDPGVVEVSEALDDEGALRAMAVGATTVWAELGGVVSPAIEVEVIDATVEGLAVSPAAVDLLVGQTLRLGASAAFSTGQTGDVGGQVRWIVEDGSVATVDATGLVTAKKAGTTQIGARLGQVASAPVAVRVGQGRPDLVVSALTVIEGGVAVTVRNVGSVGASGFWVDAFVEPVGTPAVGEVGDAFAEVAWLGPGEELSVSLPLDVDGAVEIAAVVDSTDAVDEADEGNNTRADELVWTGDLQGADVVIWDVQWLTDDVDAWLFVTLANLGDSPARAFDLAVYEDRAAAPTTATRVDATTRVSGLAPWSFVEVDVLWAPGCTTCRTWVWADPADVIGDAAPADNLDGPFDLRLEVAADTGWESGGWTW